MAHRVYSVCNYINAVTWLTDAATKALANEMN